VVASIPRNTTEKEAAMKRLLAILLLLIFAGTIGFAAGSNEETSGDGGPPTLSYYRTPPGVIATLVDSWEEAPIWQAYQERVGVNIEFVQIPQDAANHLSLLIASGDYPDMIENFWGNYPGGPAQAIIDEVILPLNDVFEQSAPNLSALIDEMQATTPGSVLAMQTGEGEFFGFPMLRFDDEAMVFVGPQLRADWLEEVGLDVPVTIDDWTEVLTAFRDEYGVAPLSGVAPLLNNRNIFSGSAFASAYEVILEWHVVDGRVQHGFAQPEIEEFLALANAWYEAGLIDPEFVTNDRSVFENKVYNGSVGAFIGFTGSSMGAYLAAMANRDPDFDLVGARYPVLNEGDYPYYGQRSGNVVPRATAISTQVSDLEAAATFLDFAYGDEGNMLVNFGIEGVSYEMDGGFPRYTDLITNNPDGLSMAAAMGLYTGISAGGSAVQDGRYAVQYLLSRPQQADAVEKWKETNAVDHLLVGVNPAPGVSDDFGAIWTEVQTYAEENLLRFITGARPIGEVGDYLAELDRIGFETARGYMQAAYDDLYGN
jgi:putative aldouronate transport system substrate-binding protein